MAKKQNDAQISVRVPSELRVNLEAIAKKQGRSLSNLVIYILKSYVENNFAFLISSTPFLLL